MEACLKYFVVGKQLLALTQYLELACFHPISTINCAGRKEAEFITLYKKA